MTLLDASPRRLGIEGLVVIGQHQFTLAHRREAWEHLEGSELKRAHDEILKMKRVLH